MTKHLPSLCLAALLLTAAPLCAQVPPTSTALPNPSSLVPDSDSSYLTPLLILRPLRASYAASLEWRDLYFEMSSFYESFIGNDAEAIADFDAALPPFPQKPAAGPKAALADYTAVDASQAIVTLAAHRQAVFINEAPSAPMDQALTLSLLRGLYAQGFRYFAAEALSEKDTQLQKRGYPLLTTGFFTQEPVFGDLIRTALKLGYKVVPYEYHGSQSVNPLTAQNQQERGAAQNLYSRIFKADPKAKVLVEAGCGHSTETLTPMHGSPGALPRTAQSGSVASLALWFRKISKIDPLCVDQASMMERSTPEYEDPLYREAVAENLLQETPVVLKNNAGHYFVFPTDPAEYDVIVFHPPTIYQFGRPSWLSEDGTRQAYVLSSDLGIPVNTPALVQAFYPKEDAKVAVPIDQIEVKPGLNPLPALMLPAGKFHLQVVDGTGKILRDWSVDRTGATP